MKPHNPFYASILLLLSAALASVFAQQSLRTMSSIDAELSCICGNESSPYTERVRLIHRLPSNLAPEQVERCRAFLESPLAGQTLPDQEFNGLKNELVEVFDYQVRKLKKHEFRRMAKTAIAERRFAFILW